VDSGSGNILDRGSGIEKNLDPGSGINIPDPQHCFLFSDHDELVGVLICDNLTGAGEHGAGAGLLPGQGHPQGLPRHRVQEDLAPCRGLPQGRRLIASHGHMDNDSSRHLI
jgi:hypothetical protein